MIRYKCFNKIRKCEIFKTTVIVFLICFLNACGIKGKPLPPIKQPFSTPNAASVPPDNEEKSVATEGLNQNSKKEKAKK